MKNEKEQPARVVGSAHTETERATASAVLPDSLIAAAPDLLAALKDIVSVLPENWGDGIREGVLPAFHLLADDVDAAFAAIAKAEGR